MAAFSHHQISLRDLFSRKLFQIGRQSFHPKLTLDFSWWLLLIVVHFVRRLKAYRLFPEMFSLSN